MLAEDSDLLYQKESVTDKYGRNFFNVSGFQLALRERNYHMQTLMMQFAPGNDIALNRKLFDQIHELKENGLSYRRGNDIINEKYFDFEKYIQLLKNQVRITNIAEQTGNWEEANRHWTSEVGQFQLSLPIHVIHEYCSKVFFDPNMGGTEFTKLPEVLTTKVRGSQKYLDWFDPELGVGSKVAIIKGDILGAVGNESTRFQDYNLEKCDIPAMKKLFKKGCESSDRLEAELKNRLANLDESKNDNCVECG